MKKENVKKNLKRILKIAAVLSLMLVISYHSDVTAFAKGTSADTSAVTAKFDNLKTLVSSCVSGLGTVVCLWGISEFGLALQGNDGMMQTHSFKRIAGGLIMIIAPQILTILT